MTTIVECVPNFSEGRRVQVVDEIINSIKMAGAQVLDLHMDEDHNRSVVTFAGAPRIVEEAAFSAVQTAARLIDLDIQRGEHPRIGATDVVPLVPISDVSMEECVMMARRVGERIGRELEIPVYLYERAATRPERRDLAYVRRGEYEVLKTEIETNPDREPDFGPRRLGKAGATVVGARPFLIAYNVNLATNDLNIAKDIARVTREKGGGLKAVKALGLELSGKGIVQVSMNLTDFQVTGMKEAFEFVREQAENRGVRVVGSELVGLVPLEALTKLAGDFLMLENLNAKQIVEMQLLTGKKQ